MNENELNPIDNAGDITPDWADGSDCSEFDGEEYCGACGEDIQFCECGDHGYDLLPGEDMDGDHASALASAGFGCDEDYGCYDGGLEDF